jgi:hypothetical protein
MKRRQGDEGKTRRSRGESPSQEDERDRPQDLEYIFIQLLKPSLTITLKLFF